eukprot:7317191-Pyramimonas_sp.AAC.1
MAASFAGVLLIARPPAMFPSATMAAAFEEDALGSDYQDERDRQVGGDNRDVICGRGIVMGVVQTGVTTDLYKHLLNLYYTSTKPILNLY